MYTFLLLILLSTLILTINGFKPLNSFNIKQNKKTTYLKSTIENFEDSNNKISKKTVIYGTTWLALTTYAFGFSPGGDIEATNLDNELIKTMISTPFDGTVNPLFVGLFNSLGIIPTIYASLLLPGASKQKIPTLPFVASSFALGFFGLGPYLALRAPQKDEYELDNIPGWQKSLESKAISIGMLLFASYLLYYSLTSLPLTENIQGFSALFSTQRLVHISTLDFTILSLAMIDPLSEDMTRRGMDGNDAFKYCLIPVFGPITYLLQRKPIINTE